MILNLLLTLLLCPARAGSVESLFPAAPAAQVAVFADLAGKTQGGSTDLAELRRFAALDYHGGGGALVLGSLELAPDVVAQAAEAARVAGDGSPQAARKLQALAAALKEARRAAYERADERGAQLAAGEDPGTSDDRDAALLALSRFYGRGLQLSRIELLRRRRGLQADGRPAARFKTAREAFARASSEAVDAFAALAASLDAQTLARHPRLRPFAELDHAGDGAAVALGTLALQPGATARVRDAALALSEGRPGAAGLPALEAELADARRAAYPHADQRGADLAAAPLHAPTGEPAADLPERAAALHALSRFHGRGLQLSDIRLQRRLIPIGLARPPRDAAASAAPPAPALAVLAGPAAPSFPEPSRLELWLLVPLIVLAAAAGYWALFSAFGEVLSLFDPTAMIDSF